MKKEEPEAVGEAEEGEGERGLESRRKKFVFNVTKEPQEHDLTRNVERWMWKS